MNNIFQLEEIKEMQFSTAMGCGMWPEEEMANAQANCFPFIVLEAIFIGLLFTFGVAFTTELYQRDSYGSPHYNASLSKSEIIRRAIVHSVSKFNRVTPNGPVANILYHEFEYLMKIRLGTPPVDIYGAADTGSDPTWTQCKPFTRTFPQRTPLFNTHASSSYAKIPCSPYKDCPPLSSSKCKADGWCHFSISYADKTYCKGLLSKEAMRIESTNGDEVDFIIPNFIFGCGTNNGGPFTSSGVIGLGAGPQSLVSQLGPLSSQRFSYCFNQLGYQDRVSHIRFGPDANLHNSRTVVVPLVNEEPSSSYIIRMKALKVGRITIEFGSLTGNVEEGNIAIDSGTVVTEVPRHLYNQIRHAVLKQTKETSVPDPDNLLNLCFKSKKSLRLPKIVASFVGGDVPFNQYNVYVDMGTVTCLAIAANDSPDELSLYGSLFQQDFIVAYDLSRRTVSFTPFDCTAF